MNINVTFITANSIISIIYVVPEKMLMLCTRMHFCAKILFINFSIWHHPHWSLWEGLEPHAMHIVANTVKHHFNNTNRTARKYMIHAYVFTETNWSDLFVQFVVHSIHPHAEMPSLIIRFIKIGTALMAACVSADFRQTTLHY